MDLEESDSLIKILQDEFTCPIYKMPIQNPVITPVGITYEKMALQEWLDVNGIEPQSKKPLDKNNLIQNLALKGLVSKIYKEVPKLERALTEKDEIIANLTEEVTQLKKALLSEKEKNQENQELMECTFEKTKKIRKIHERTNNENEVEMAKLKEKVKQISKVKMELKQAMGRQKVLSCESESHKSEINRLNIELREERSEVKRLNQRVKNIVDQRRISVKGFKQLELEAFSNYKSEFWHRQHIVESVLNNIDKIASEFTGKSYSLRRVKQIINAGVDDILSRRQEDLIEGMQSEERKSSARQLSKALKNRINIQRYILDLQHQEDQDNPLYYHYRLSKIANAVGYDIDFLPFSLPPTQIQMQLDWNKVIKIYCQFTEEKWQLFISQIGKFPNLTQINTSDFTVTNLTSAQLSSIPNLKRMEIEGWTTIDQTQRNEIDTFKATHPQVKITILRNDQDENPFDSDFEGVINLEVLWGIRN